MRNRFLNSWGVGVIGLVLSLTSGCEDDPVVEVNANLPAGINLSYDGLTLEL